MASGSSIRNDPRTIFGWAMYDWANSAFATTVTALLPAFFAAVIVPAGGFPVFGRLYDGQTLWGYLNSFAALVVFLALPVLGALGDFTNTKRRFLTVFMVFGSGLMAILPLVIGQGDVLLTMGLYFLVLVSFSSGNVFYDGFLTDITTPDTIDRVSAKGFAIGYVGGGIQLAVAIALIALHGPLGISQDLAVRLGLASVGIWWLGFGLFAISRLRETGRAQAIPEEYRALPRWTALTRVGFERTWATTKRLRHFPQLMLFVLAFIVYNDGVATTIAMSSVYATDTLRLDAQTIALTFLVVQFVAFFGALAFGRLAVWIGAQRAILISLILWTGIMVFAYFLREGAALQFLVLGALVGLVLGGTQALSRSLYGSMIPEQASAEFFGFYSVFSKFSAIWGPFTFALVSDLTGSARNSILSLIAFFVVGAVLLAKVDVEEARASRLRWDFEASEVEVKGLG